MNITIIGLSITSSWGNGHAVTYRSLVKELCQRGHRVLFLERETEWYSSNRDMPRPPYGRTELYTSLNDLKGRFTGEVADSDVVIVGSYVPEGVDVGRWAVSTARGVKAFYDIDTPVTLARIKRGDELYLSKDLIPRFDIYLSFTGGPILDAIETKYGSPMARPLYCSVDSQIYYPERLEPRWEMGYLGTYSADRQPVLERFMFEATKTVRKKFVVAGPLYPDGIVWPDNVDRIEHLCPAKHRGFYNSVGFALNITRADMVRAGWSPSVRLFEAASCGVPVISDWWEGLDSFFEPGEEILIAKSTQDIVRHLGGMGEKERQEIGLRARARILRAHTAVHRVDELEGYIREVREVT